MQQRQKASKLKKKPSRRQYFVCIPTMSLGETLLLDLYLSSFDQINFRLHFLQGIRIVVYYSVNQEVNIYILLEVLLCSIAEYFYELCRILASP